MQNYYFTYWIARYGKDTFKNLADRICQKIKMPIEIIKIVSKDEVLLQYCLVVYYVVTLNYFGLNKRQISLMLDLGLTPGTSVAFPPGEILEDQRELIPEIEEYIRRDLNLYNKWGGV